MAPKETTFTGPAVLEAALDVIREQGWSGLTARSVAKRLGASVAPVYSAFGSMKSLQKETLRRIRALLQEYTTRATTEIPFLNIGVGIVSFARDEPALFLTLFNTRHGFQDIVEGVNTSILSWMRDDSQLGLLSQTSRERLFANIGYFTMGLASAVAAGRVADVSKENIVRLVKDMGNIAMFAEISGVADSASPENAREWTRLLAEKNISLPAAETPSAHKGHPARPSPDKSPTSGPSNPKSRRRSDP